MMVNTALINKGILSAAAITVFATTAQAATLIQCPDWQSLVAHTPTITLAKHAPKVAFDKKLSQRDITAKAGSGLGSPKTTRTKTASNQSCPTYKVKRGDTLANISQKFLGTPKRYKDLMAANKSKVTSVEALPVGTVLTIPCDLGTAVAKVSNPKPKSKKTGGFSTIFAKQSKPLAVSKPIVKPIPIKPAKPLPIWTARSGEYLSDVIKRWGKKAGYKIILTGSDAWLLHVPIKEVGTFEDSLQRLIKGFSAQGTAPSVRIFSNKVIKIGSIL